MATCEICNKQVDDLETHKKQFHGALNEMYAEEFNHCTQCTRKFGDDEQDKYIQHIKETGHDEGFLKLIGQEYGMPSSFDLSDKIGKYEMLSKVDVDVKTAKALSKVTFAELPENIKERLVYKWGNENVVNNAIERFAAEARVEELPDGTFGFFDKNEVFVRSFNDEDSAVKFLLWWKKQGGEGLAREVVWYCDDCGKTIGDGYDAGKHKEETGHRNIGKNLKNRLYLGKDKPIEPDYPTESFAKESKWEVSTLFSGKIPIELGVKATKEDVIKQVKRMGINDEILGITKIGESSEWVDDKKMYSAMQRGFNPLKEKDWYKKSKEEKEKILDSYESYDAFVCETCDYGTLSTSEAVAHEHDMKHLRYTKENISYQGRWATLRYDEKTDALEALGYSQFDALQLGRLDWYDLANEVRQKLSNITIEHAVEVVHEAPKDEIDYEKLNKNLFAIENVCDNCNGEGFITVGNYMFSGDGAKDIECPECGGTGNATEALKVKNNILKQIKKIVTNYGVYSPLLDPLLSELSWEEQKEIFGGSLGKLSGNDVIANINRLISQEPLANEFSLKDYQRNEDDYRRRYEISQKYYSRLANEAYPRQMDFQKLSNGKTLCMNCDQMFGSYGDFLKHYGKTHANEVEFERRQDLEPDYDSLNKQYNPDNKCGMCGKTFSNRQELQDHISEKGQHNRMSESIAEERGHEFSYTKNDDSGKFCGCGYVADNEQDLKRHVEIEHDNWSGTGESLTKFIDSIANEYETDYNDFKCKKCGKQFTSNDELVNHWVEKHNYNVDKGEFANEMWGDKFNVGDYIVNDNGKYGKIIRIITENPDGSQFFDVAYTFGKSRNRSDHQIRKVSSSQVSKDQKELIASNEAVATEEIGGVCKFCHGEVGDIYNHVKNEHPEEFKKVVKATSSEHDAQLWDTWTPEERANRLEDIGIYPNNNKFLNTQWSSLPSDLKQELELSD